LQASVPLIAGIAEIIRTNPSYTVEIDGHTDTVPIHTSRFPSNWELSVARATSVLKYFIDVQGMDPSRFYVKGNADQRPVAPNDTPEQRAQNRRVEIRLRNSS
jgi:chemotaxis protein MotB